MGILCDGDSNDSSARAMPDEARAVVLRRMCTWRMASVLGAAIQLQRVGHSRSRPVPAKSVSCGRVSCLRRVLADVC